MNVNFIVTCLPLQHTTQCYLTKHYTVPYLLLLPHVKYDLDEKVQKIYDLDEKEFCAKIDTI